MIINKKKTLWSLPVIFDYSFIISSITIIVVTIILFNLFLFISETDIFLLL